MDNLSALATLIGQQIDPLGADGSILAVNHRDRLIEVMTKAGKYNGLYFLAELNRLTYPAGTMSWNDFSMNQAGDFEIIVSRLTADLNDAGDILTAIGKSTILHFKDFNGRSGMYRLKSVTSDTIGTDDVYRIILNSLSTNPGYTYQPTEKLICGLHFNANINKIHEFGDLAVYKNSANTDPNQVEPGDTVIGQLNGDIFLVRGTYVSGDPMDLTSYDDNSDFYDPNENVV